MVLDWLPHKQLSATPFIPVLLTLAAELLGLRVANKLVQRADTELKDRGIDEEHQVQGALRIVQGFSLLMQIYSGLLPLIGSLLIVVISLPPNGGWSPVVIGVCIGAVLVLLICLFLFIGPLGDIYWDNIAATSWYKRGLQRLHITNAGVLWTVIFIVVTTLIQLLIAYLLLPDST